MVLLSHPYTITVKTIALTRWTFVGKVISLLFNTLSTLVIAFLPRSSSVQLSCVQLFATPWTAARQASLSITNSWSLLKLMFIELVMQSNHLILCQPLLLPPSIFFSIRVFSSESVLPISWPKVLEFQLQHQSFQWIVVKSLSRVRLFVTLWTVAYQASPSMGFSRQEYWSGLPFPSPGDLPDRDRTQVFHIGGRPFNLWATREALPMNIQGLFPLGWTGWISLLSKGLSRVFSNTTAQKYQFFSAQLSL